MALESALNDHSDESQGGESGPPALQSEDSKDQLSGFWFWLPIVIAAIGGIMVAILLGLATFIAVDAGSAGYAVAFAMTGLFALVAPPGLIALVVRWINKEMKSGAEG